MLVLTQFELDKFPYASDTEVLFRFAHAADGVPAPVIGASPDLTDSLIDGVEYLELSEPLPLGVADLFAYVDVTEDGNPDARVFLPFADAQILPGETVLAIAHLDIDGNLAVAVHDSFAVPEAFDGILAFGFAAPVLPVPPSATDAGVGVVHLVPDAGTAQVLVGGEPVSFQGVTEVAFAEAAGFAKLPLGVTNFELAVDGLPAPIPLATPALAAGQRALAVAHLDGDLDPAVSFFTPSTAPIADANNVRIHVLHANPLVDSVNIGVEADAPLITDLAFGSLSAGIEVPVADYSFSLDANDDGVYDLAIAADLETLGVPAGSVVVVVAYANAETDLVIGALVLVEDFDTVNFEGALSALAFVPELDYGIWVDEPDIFVERTAVGLAIPDGTSSNPSSVSTTVTISGATCDGVVRLDADFGFAHTWSTDLDFYLTAPGGTQVLLGGPTDRFATVYEYSSETAFAGVTNVNGDWTVRVTDNGSGDTGTLNTIALSIWCD
jgi:subtilisin-like proprotein convertase family protein